MISCGEGYARSFQDVPPEILDLVHSELFHGLRHVREEVESAVRGTHMDTLHAVQNGDSRVAPLAQNIQHPPVIVLRPFQCGNPRPLDEVVGTGLVVDIESRNGLDDIPGTDRGTQAPSCHGEFLGKSVENDRPLGKTREASDAHRGAVKENIEISLVAEDVEIVLHADLSQPSHLFPT